MNLDEILKPADVIGISGHVRPDGDCVGSTLGLYQYIRNHYPEKEVTLYLEEIPDAFHIMPGVDQICHTAEFPQILRPDTSSPDSEIPWDAPLRIF